MAGEYSNIRAAKGQAINLAVQDAISLGKQEDTKYIIKKYLSYYKLAALLQEATIEEVEKL